MARFDVDVNGEVYEVDGVDTPEEAYQHVRAMIGPQPGEEGFEHDFDALEMVKNIPGSGWKLVKDTWEAISHPIQTGTALANLVEGGFKTVAGVELGDEERQAVDAFTGMLKERYGGWEEFQRTLETDPAGAMSDIGAVFTGAGGLASRAPGVVGDVGRTVARAGARMEPLTLGADVAKTVGKGVGALVPSERLYGGAITFPKRVPFEDREKAVRAGLEHDLPPTEAGVRMIPEVEADLAARLNDLIEEAGAAGTEIPAGAIHRVIGEIRDNIGLDMRSAQAVKKLDKLEDQWRQRMESLGKDSMTLEEIQKFKLDTDDLINWNRRDTRKTPIEEQVHKGVRREARQQIERQVPAARDLNDQLAGLEILEEPLMGAATKKTSPLNLRNIALMSAGGAGELIPGIPPGVTTGLAAAGIALDHPRVRAAIAQIGHRLKTRDVDWLRENMKIPAVALVVEQIGRTMEGGGEPLQVPIEGGVPPEEQ